MENQEKIVVKLKELPVRPERLSLENVQNIFGGCSGLGGVCLKLSDCCSGTTCKGSQCQPNSPNYGNVA